MDPFVLIVALISLFLMVLGWIFSGRVIRENGRRLPVYLLYLIATVMAAVSVRCLQAVRPAGTAGFSDGKEPFRSDPADRDRLRNVCGHRHQSEYYGRRHHLPSGTPPLRPGFHKRKEAFRETVSPLELPLCDRTDHTVFDQKQCEHDPVSVFTGLFPGPDIHSSLFASAVTDHLHLCSRLCAVGLFPRLQHAGRQQYDPEDAGVADLLFLGPSLRSRYLGDQLSS